MSYAIGLTIDEKLVLRKSDLDTHMHVIGASGVGKSYFLEHLLRRFIVQGKGVCLIDPHGEIYENLVTWLACSGYKSKEVHLLNPSQSEHSVGFNPLAIDREPTRCVADMINAIVRVWGGNNMSDTPRLKKCLRMTLYALAHHRLSLLEADIFTSNRHKKLRQKLVAELPITAQRNEWAEFDIYSDKEFREYFESTRSRLFEFTSAPSIAPIIGQTQNTLDFRECMERQHIVLVNLAESATFHKQEGQLLGAMLTAEMYSSAKQRNVEQAKGSPFYAVIDECADFINEDISKSLDETRKYGLHYVLSHQRLQQLRNVSDDCYDAVMANAQAKVVFRVNDDENAQVLCRQLFRSEFDLEKPKEILSKPVAVGQEIIELFSHSETEGESHTSSSSEAVGSSTVSSHADSSANSVFTPLDGTSPGHTDIAGMSMGSGSATSHSSSSASADTSTSSRTAGTSQSLKTVYEVLPSAVYNLEEIMHLGTRAIRELPDRNAIAVLPGRKPARITTLDVKGYRPLPMQVSQATGQLSEDSRFTKSISAVEEEIGLRQSGLFEIDDRVFEDRYDPNDYMD